MKKTALNQAKLGLRIGDIMTRDIAVIHPAATLKEAARQMRDRDVGLLPVLDGSRVLGLVTDRDLVVRAIAQGLNPAQTRVRDIMTTDVVYCFAHEDVHEAVESMETAQIRRVLVLDRKKRLAGILSIGDLAVDTGDRQLAGEVLKKVSEPEKVVRWHRPAGR